MKLLKSVLILFSLIICLSLNAYAADRCDDLVYLKSCNAKASSFDDTEDPPLSPDAMALFDGNFNSRWSPLLGYDNEWIYCDFGKPKTISKIIIWWEVAYAIDYEILISDDAENWKRVILMEGQDGGKDEITFSAVTGRYLKIVGLKRFNKNWGFSMWEFEPYGPKELNPGDEPIGLVYPDRKVPGLKKIKLVIEEPLPSPGPINKNEFHKGMSYNSYRETELLNEISDEVIQKIYEQNVRHITLVVLWYQDTIESSEIYPESMDGGGRTVVDEALSHAINKIHSLGIKVMLKPHVDVQDGEFRGYIIPNSEWFASYEKFILHYAKLAAKYNVELFCIGTELGETTMPKWENNWRQVIRKTREEYQGPLVYAANHDEYQDVPFWDDLDFIGIDAYFKLTQEKDPTKKELIKAWEEQADEIEAWKNGKGFKQPILFTEIGYTSTNGSNRTPWAKATFIEDQQEQADCLDAVLTVLSEKDWFKGMYWWESKVHTNTIPLDYTLWGKVGQKVLSDWYKRIN